MKEIAQLKQDPPEGVRISLDDDGQDIIHNLTGIVAGPEGTPFEGGYFRIAFTFTPEFPNAPPRCRMLTKIFHPNFSSSGEICVNTLKKDWKSSYGIGHILVTIKCLLIHPNPESALDEEAGKLLLENYEEFCQRAKIITGVHATPKVRPVEFETQASASSSKPKPIVSASSTAVSVPISAPTLRSTSGSRRKSVSPMPPDDENKHSSILSEKDKLVGAVAAVTKPAMSILQPSTSNGANSPMKMAVKRPAAAGGVPEKKKKALKRL